MGIDSSIMLDGYFVLLWMEVILFCVSFCRGRFNIFCVWLFGLIDICNLLFLWISVLVGNILMCIFIIFFGINNCFVDWVK